MKVIQKMSPLNRKTAGKKFILPHEVQPLTTLSQSFIFAIITGKYEKGIKFRDSREQKWSLPVKPVSNLCLSIPVAAITC